MTEQSAWTMPSAEAYEFHVLAAFCTEKYSSDQNFNLDLCLSLCQIILSQWKTLLNHIVAKKKCDRRFSSLISHHLGDYRARHSYCMIPVRSPCPIRSTPSMFQWKLKEIWLNSPKTSSIQVCLMLKQTTCIYHILSNRRPCLNRRPPPSSPSSWHTIHEINDFRMEMHRFDARCWAHHHAPTSCLAHAQCAPIWMNTV